MKLFHLLPPGSKIPFLDLLSFHRKGVRIPDFNPLFMKAYKHNKQRQKEQRSFNIFREFAVRVLQWLSTTFIPEGHRVPIGTVKPYLDKLGVIAQTRGLDSAIKYNKLVRSAIYSYLSNSDIRQDGLSKTNDHLPRSLGPLIPLIRGGTMVEDSPYTLRWILTLLSSTRALNTGRQPNYSPITTPSNYRVSKDMQSDVIAFWKTLGFSGGLSKETGQVSFKKFHLSTKSGPNGQALYSSLSDLLVLPESLIKSIGLVGGETLLLKITTLRRNLTNLMKLFGLKKASSYRKVTSFPDKEDKVRVIAILDYWSQTALRPLHSFLFHRVLKKIPQDCTFNQGAFLMKLKPGLYHSIDLKDATDRFPLEVIQRLLEGRFSKEYCDAWKDIMVGYPFEVKDSTLKEVRYAVGNPMGAYSSWASFALAHHFVVFQACRRLRRDWRTANYVLLGDDIVLADSEIAKGYMALLQELDIPFSLAKTHTSPLFYEFAKRLIYKGVEISPFPIGGLSEVKRRYNLLVAFLISLENKGWKSHQSYDLIVESFYSLVFHLRSKMRHQLGTKARLTECITRVILGLTSATEGLKNFLLASEEPNFRSLEITEELAAHQFKTAALTLFAESNSDERRTKGKPLGALAVRLVEILTDPTSVFGDDSFELIYCIPILGLHGLVEEMYLQIQKDARRIDTLEGGDWPLFLRSLTMPLSDEVYVLRNFDIIPSFSAALASKIKEQLAMLRQWYDH